MNILMASLPQILKLSCRVPHKTVLNVSSTSNSLLVRFKGSLSIDNSFPRPRNEIKCAPYLYCGSLINNFTKLPNYRVTTCGYSSTDKGFKENSQIKVKTGADVNSSKKLTQKARLKQAVRDYGATIVVFHVAISLASLGICYIAISNGVDAVKVLKFLHFPESVVSSGIAVGGSTFVIAYALHKVFAPVRIAITLSSAPFIVRYLRKIKWIKPPKNM